MGEFIKEKEEEMRKIALCCLELSKLKGNNKILINDLKNDYKEINEKIYEIKLAFINR